MFACTGTVTLIPKSKGSEWLSFCNYIVVKLQQYSFMLYAVVTSLKHGQTYVCIVSFNSYCFCVCTLNSMTNCYPAASQKRVFCAREKLFAIMNMIKLIQEVKDSVSLFTRTVVSSTLE